MTYPLMTPRLSIVPLTAHDAAGFVAYRQDPDVARWQGWDPTYSDAEAAKLIASQPSADVPDSGGWLQLAIHDRGFGKLQGDVAVHSLTDVPDTCEIGITLAPANQIDVEFFTGEWITLDGYAIHHAEHATQSSGAVRL
jgi:RimJ/RimL family protein N-acetyltransferase